MKMKEVEHEAWDYKNVTEGLARHEDDKPAEYVTITEIVVPSERDKAQLIKAFKYIHNLNEIDTDFIAVNLLAHLYQHPDLIKVTGAK